MTPRLGDGEGQRLIVARDFDVTGQLELFEHANGTGQITGKLFMIIFYKLICGD